MVEALRLRTGLLVALLAVLSACAIAAASPTNANAAGNATFCWGTWLQSKGSTCNPGVTVGNTTQVVGSGAQHSVCVWSNNAGRIMCSSGPYQSVYNTSMSGCVYCGFPMINNNGYSPNQVFGRVYWS
jgi:hypothetical protein